MNITKKVLQEKKIIKQQLIYLIQETSENLEKKKKNKTSYSTNEV